MPTHTTLAEQLIMRAVLADPGSAHLRPGDALPLSRYANAVCEWRDAKAALAGLKIGSKREVVVHARKVAAERTLQALEKALGLVASHRARLLSVLAAREAVPTRSGLPSSPPVVADAEPGAEVPKLNPIGWGVN